MNFLSTITFDQIAASLLACLIVRELLIIALPDHIAGPGGSFIDTGEEEA